MEQLNDNLGAADIKLSDEDTSTLHEITHPPVLYPEWMYAKMANEELSEHVT